MVMPIAQIRNMPFLRTYRPLKINEEVPDLETTLTFHQYLLMNLLRVSFSDQNVQRLDLSVLLE